MRLEKKVDDTQKESISMHSALKEQLLGLKDLNQQMTKEAINLTRALKGDSNENGNLRPFLELEIVNGLLPVLLVVIVLLPAPLLSPPLPLVEATVTISALSALATRSRDRR